VSGVFSRDEFFITKIGENRGRTPEGFLLCRNVPIARIGSQLYNRTEVPDDLECNDDGLILVERLPEDVFSEDHVNSYNGKPVVIDHPHTEDHDWDVHPGNVSQFQVGTAINPRRGTGDADDLLLADLLITDKRGIDEVESGRRVQVSCGYNAEYEPIAKGRARQKDFVGNHVALVKAARCGYRCTIGDEDMRVRDHAPSLIERARDGLRSAFMTKDEKKFNESLAELETISGKGRDDESGMHIHLHNGAEAPAASNTNKEKAADDPYEARFKGIEDGIGALTKGLSDCMGMIKGMGAKDTKEDEEKTEDDLPDESTGDEKEDEDDKAKDAKEDEDDDKKSKDKSKDAASRHRMKDSSGLAAAVQDAISKAEIISPGVASMSFNERAPARDTMTDLCAFRRRVLNRAHDADGGAELFEALLGGQKVKDAIKSMPCTEVMTTFNAAAALRRSQNNKSSSGGGKSRDENVKSKIASLADLNAANRKFFKQDPNGMTTR
jgi:hypothetical protein